jgi:hypothetical protein
MSNSRFYIEQTSGGQASGFVINASNNIGIGTESPSSKLHVLGTTISTDFRPTGSTNNGRIYADDWGIKVGTDSGHVWIGPANTGHAHIYTDRPNFYFNKDLLVNGSTVFHTGNDGAGSGLDADTLDGVQGTNYFRVDGTYPNNNMNVPVEGFWHIQSDATGIPIPYYGHRWDYDHLNNGQWVAQFYSATGDTDSLWFRQIRNYATQPWQKLWSSTNDGSGSGLDADLLDGLNSTDFLGLSTGGSIDVNSTSLGTKLFVGSSGTWSNRGPTTHNGQALFSINTHPGTYYSQLWFDTGGNNFYHRTNNVGSVSSWNIVWHAGNLTNLNQLTNGPGYTSYSANQAVDTTSGPTFAEVYNNGWFRNNNPSTGLYNQNTTAHFYSRNSSSYTIYTTQNTSQLLFETSGQSTRGSISADSSNNIGFRNNIGTDTFRINASGDVIAGGSRLLGAVAVGQNTNASFTLPTGCRAIEVQMQQNSTTESNTIQRFYLTTASTFSLGSTQRNARVTWFDGSFARTMTILYTLSGSNFTIQHNFNFTVGYRIYAHF